MATLRRTGCGLGEGAVLGNTGGIEDQTWASISHPGGAPRVL